MNFGDAIAAIKAGKKVARSGWDQKTTWIFLIAAGSTIVTPTEPVAVAAPFVAMKTTNGPVVPWVASHYDMLSENWQIVP